MDPEYLDQVKSIFFRATEIDSGAREHFLNEACAGNENLRAEVERLLLQHDASPPTGIFEEPTKVAPVQALPEGTVLSNRFRIIRFVGRGGMGEVYRATDLDLGGDVALKILLPELVDDRQFLGRFRREVQLARQVTHPNICRIFDVGRDVHQGKEFVFLTMEFLDGSTLSAYLRRNGAMTTSEALPILQQMAAGLGALHDKNIIHRDFKPGNVMIVPTPSGKQRSVIGDFGLARTVDTALPLDKQDETLSRPGHFYGTFGYMAPEQLRAKPLTTATDIYAFGLVMYEMVSGKRLFPGAVTLDDAVQRVNEEVALPTDHGLPEDWESAIMQCLAREPQQRPPSAMAALATLEGTVIAPRSGATARSGVTRQVDTAPNETAMKAPEPKRRFRAWMLVVPALAGLALMIPSVRERLGPVTPSSSTVRDDRAKAKELLRNYYRPNHLSEAITLLEKLVAQDPKSALDHTDLGWAYWMRFLNTRDAAWKEKARAALDRAVELGPYLAGPHVALAEIYLDGSRSDLAADQIQQALRLDSRNGNAYATLAKLHQAQGRDKEVEPALQKAVDLDPDNWRQLTSLGLYYRTARRLPEAARLLERVTELTPDNPAAFNNLGLTYWNQDRFADARAAYQKSLDLEPRYRTYANLGTVLMLEGKLTEAAKVLRESIALNPTNFRAVGALATCYAWSPENKGKANEQYLKAIELAEQTRKESPKDAQLLATLGSWYAAVGKPSQSLPLLRQALALSPDGAEILMSAGEGYNLLGKREEAVSLIDKAIDLGYSKEVIRRNPELAGLRTHPRLEGKLR
jgi:serine/threonine protein kinase/Tfp pilus assembly protein PilF